MSGRREKARRRTNGHAVRHFRKLFGGKMTAEEVHSQALAGAGIRCASCQMPAVVILRSQATLIDLEHYAPQWCAAIRASNPNGDYVPTFPTRYGPMVNISTIGACRMCRRAAERAAAKHPSWIHVEINEGPGADRPIVSVA